MPFSARTRSAAAARAEVPKASKRRAYVVRPLLSFVLLPEVSCDELGRGNRERAGLGVVALSSPASIVCGVEDADEGVVVRPWRESAYDGALAPELAPDEGGGAM